MYDITIGSLCSGYGGLEMGVILGAYYAGVRVRVLWQIDNDPNACLILKHRRAEGYFSKSQIVCANIEDVDYDALPKVDLICAGLPCQPWTNAGDQKGWDDPRNLFPAFFRICDTVQPASIFLENADELPGADDGASFRRIVGEVAARWTHCEWGSLTAASVGADHERERLFLFAHTDRERLGRAQTPGARTSALHARRQGASQKPGRQHLIHSFASGRAHPYADGVDVEGPSRNNRSRIQHAAHDGYHPAPLPRYLLAQSRFRRADDGLAARLDEHTFSRGLVDTSRDIAPRVVFEQKPADWNNRLAALGNGVVPQQAAVPAYALFKSWLGE